MKTSVPMLVILTQALAGNENHVENLLPPPHLIFAVYTEQLWFTVHFRGKAKIQNSSHKG